MGAVGWCRVGCWVVRVLFGVVESAILSGPASVLFLGDTRWPGAAAPSCSPLVEGVGCRANARKSGDLPVRGACCSCVYFFPSFLFLLLSGPLLSRSSFYDCLLLALGALQTCTTERRLNQPTCCLPLCSAAARSGRHGAHALPPPPLVMTTAVRRHVQLLPPDVVAMPPVWRPPVWWVGKVAVGGVVQGRFLLFGDCSGAVNAPRHV